MHFCKRGGCGKGRAEWPSAPVRMRHRLQSAAKVPMLITVKPDLSCSTRKPLSCGVGLARTEVYLTEPADAACFLSHGF